jgi:hypothetical protein
VNSVAARLPNPNFCRQHYSHTFTAESFFDRRLQAAWVSTCVTITNFTDNSDLPSSCLAHSRANSWQHSSTKRQPQLPDIVMTPNNNLAWFHSPQIQKAITNRSAEDSPRLCARLHTARSKLHICVPTRSDTHTHTTATTTNVFSRHVTLLHTART